MLNRLRAVIACLHSHDVRYVTIGGIAAALEQAGLGTATLITPRELLEQVITVFNDRVRVDVQTSTPGLAFHAAWERRETFDHAGHPIYVVSRADLIASKRASARPVDLQDVQVLETELDQDG